MSCFAPDAPFLTRVCLPTLFVVADQAASLTSWMSCFAPVAPVSYAPVSSQPCLSLQIKLEFDFRREARIMDAVARQFEVRPYSFVGSCIWFGHVL